MTPAAPAHVTADRFAEISLRQRLLDDEPGAWRDFEAAYGRLVSSTIARIMSRFGSRCGSEDVREIHAAFCLDLLSNDRAKLRAFSPERNVRLSTWIAMLASHAAYDFLRRRRREPLAEFEWDADALSSEAPDPYSLCETGERIRIVSALLEEFSAKDREFLALYFGEGLPAEEVASRMRISIKTVYTKKHKIRGRLEALLEGRALAA